MKKIQWVIILIFPVFSNQFSCSKTGTTTQQSGSGNSIVLLAGTGFSDSNNDVNMYGSELYFIHGNDRYNDLGTGYFSVPFIKDTTGVFPQLVMSFSKLQLNKPFTVSLRIWANLNTDYSQVCSFVIKKNNDNGTLIDTTITFHENHIPIQQGEYEDVQIKITDPKQFTKNGIYYFSVWGTYNNTNLWYEISQVTVTYD